ncbi:alpha-1,6-glucosidase domain-containing protein [Colwellia echini]|uniref:alpha-1,6-glucosidase domain-containing protein n=1 Tax=Colwellia echini TaxID=1982103 RepID=UPI001FECEF62|nr:alpha-1,6-glucosidase domain-containing protein [Colwellia echini]
MNIPNNFKKIVLVTLISGSVISCGGDKDNTDTPPAVIVETLPDPVVTAADDQLLIFYNRPDSEYDGWALHLWNNEACNAYADFGADEGTAWDAGQVQTGIDPNYGAYWVLNLSEDHNECANAILHNGDDKDISSGDLRFDLTGDRTFWTLSGFSELNETALLYPTGAFIKNTAAHWVSPTTVFWQQDDAVKVRVYSADVDDLGYNPDTGIAGDNYIEFIAQSENPAVELGMPRYSDLTTFTTTTADADKVKAMLKGKLLAISYDADNELVGATYVQTPRVIDALYTQGEADANEASLGLTYNSNDITASVWAPTAKDVKLNIYNSAKELQSTEPMVLDNDTGIWSFTTPITNDRMFYRYELSVYHQQNLVFETLETTDPYSVSLSTNGEYSQFVNLADADLKPAGWEDHVIPVIADPEDAVIYEGHIRDFSILDSSTTEANRGKYLAFAEQDSAPVMHLKSLAAAGLTHFQMLPSNDIASIDEDESTRVNITDTVADLCAEDKAPGAAVCGVEDPASTLLEVFASYDADSKDAQALTQSLRGLDSFNWGYDPKHFTTPDGSYSSNADGVARIIEMRTMNQALHGIGLRVVLDVVYNHTSASGLTGNSVLDKVVPGYYHRRDLISGNVIQDTCCQDTAPEHVMMDKLMQDSLLVWTKEYKFDGFRFDIMSNNSVDSILAARTAVQAIDSDNYFYGEGWTRNDHGYAQAQQNNMAGTSVGTFNDRPRDTIRGASLFGSENKFADQDVIRLGLAGTLENYQLQAQNGRTASGKNFAQSSYAKDPADIINYVSKHDNETLWDQLQYGLPTDMMLSDRVRAQNIAATIPLMSQGIPFFQFGGDFIRSKSMDRNTYDAGDWYNKVDFTKMTSNWNKGLPLAEDNEAKWTDMRKLVANSEIQVQQNDIELASDVFAEFLAIRHSSKLFKLTTAQDVYDRVGFHNTGRDQSQGLIVMSLDDGTGLTDLDPENDAIMVIINGSSAEQSHSIAEASGFELHSVQQNSVDSTVQMASFTEDGGTFTVPALTTAVFVKPQGASQGYGLPAGLLRDLPDVAPYGDSAVYMRGSMNDWSADDDYLFSYVEDGVYTLEVELIAGQQTFKFADSSWNNVDLGFGNVSFTADSVVVADDGGNMSFAVESDGLYTIKLDANSETPAVTITSIAPTFSCDALADSTDPIPYSIAGGGQLYVKGDHSGWGAQEAYRLHYKGDNVYQAVADFDGTLNFKLASDDADWDTQVWAQAEGSAAINTETLAVGVSYSVSNDSAGQDNNKTTLAAGKYSFLLTLNEANPAVGSDIGTLIIQECE